MKTSDNEWQRAVQRMATSGATIDIKAFQTYIVHRVLFHHFLKRFRQI